jgi:hypothetical protein
LLCAALLAGLLQPAQTGYAARYSTEGKMRRAAALHGVDVPAGVEVCASPHHALGTVIVVRSSRGVWKCVVGDVPHARDRAAIVARNIVVEVTPRGAMRLCGSVREPPRQCPVTVERSRV